MSQYSAEVAAIDSSISVYKKVSELGKAGLIASSTAAVTGMSVGLGVATKTIELISSIDLNKNTHDTLSSTGLVVAFAMSYTTVGFAAARIAGVVSLYEARSDKKALEQEKEAYQQNTYETS